MPSKHLIRNLFMAISLIIVCSLPSFACSTNGIESMFGSFKTSKTVFLGKIVSFKKKSGRDLSAENIRGTYVLVKEAYKGDVSPGDVVFLKQGNGADCGNWYDGEDIGEIEFFYLNEVRKSKRVKTLDTSEIPSFPSWEHDLLFLRKAKFYRGKTRISGLLYLANEEEEKYKHWRYMLSETLPGQKITITGLSGIYETVTDKNGVYELYGLPPGLYFIRPDIPDTLIYGWFIYPDLQGLEENAAEIGRQYKAIKEKYPDAIAQSPQYVFLPSGEHAEISLVYKRK